MMHTRAERKVLSEGQPARGAAARSASLDNTKMHTRAERKELSEEQPARGAAARRASLD